MGNVEGTEVEPALASSTPNEGDAPLGPPVARRKPLRQTVHGVELVDEYAWLAERGSRESLAYLEAENRYADWVLGRTESLRQALYDEFVGRIQQTDMSVPVRLDDNYYYSRTEEGRQYRIYCRRRGAPDAPEEVMLDLNELAEGAEFFRLGAVEVSPDHRLLAFTVDLTGGESYRLLVKDLDSGELHDEGLEGAAASICWAADSATLFYATLDAVKRPYRVFRHSLGETGADVEVYREDDEAFYVSLRRTRSREFVLMTSASNVTSEVLYIPADRPATVPQSVEPRRAGVEYWVDHHGDSFYLRTNAAAKNFRLVRRPVGTLGEADDEVLAHRPEVKLESAELFADHLVLWEREAGLQRIRVRSYDNSRDEIVPLPESVYTVLPESNPEFSATEYRFGYTSLVTPPTVFSYDCETGGLETLKVQEVLGGFDKARYTTTRIRATAPDGVEVPITLAHRRDLALDGTSPCLLYGYGAYGTTVDPSFSVVNVSMLDRGFVLATAHVRGGGLLGEGWHEAGRMLAKRNSFDDFVAAAEHLIAARYTAAERLAVRGGSAGGLLLGAALNLRPDLFRVAVAQVPFVDVVNTMLDASIPLTVIEYEEWGDPRRRDYFEYMLSYSPYDNVGPRDYPALLVTAGLNDPRVQYWEPAKWVARLRALKTDDNPLLLRTHMGAGHGGPSGRYEVLRERALECAFVIDGLGVGELPPDR